MFARRFFAGRFFAPRYWPQSQGDAPEPPVGGAAVNDAQFLVDVGRMMQR